MADTQVKTNILSWIHPYQKKEIPLYDEGWIRLDRNESRFGVSSRVREAVCSGLKKISSYPENTGLRLRRSIARYHQIDPDCILIGNGSFELLELIASVYLDQDSESILPAPTFGWYKTYSTLYGGSVAEVPLAHDEIDLEGIRNRVTDKTKLIWLCNPNNPTGHYISSEQIREFLQTIPSHILVVIDEAYLEFIDYYTPRESIDLLESFKNVILLRTFSKFYGLASLRIGYAMAAPQIVQNLFQFRIPPNHSRIAETAAKVSIEDLSFQKEVREKVNQERSYLYAKLSELKIIYLQTQANFLIFRIPGTKAGDVINRLKKEHILVKSGQKFGLDQWIRLTVGDREANQHVVSVLKKLI